MFDIKRINPGITYLNHLRTLNGEITNVASEKAELAPPAKLIKAAQKAIANGQNQYADMNGYFPLREKVSQFIQNEYGYAFNPEEEITITAGSAQAINAAISAFIREGDEVILFEPAFYAYDSIIMANGGRPVYIQMKQPDFHIDWDEVQKVINTRTKIIVVNSPHYPTGNLFTTGDMEKLAKMVNGTKIIILSDESFDRIVYEGYSHQSMARYPKLAEHSLVFSSFGKALHTEGWKIGYCAGPAKLLATFRKVHHLQTYSVNLPFQVAIADILADFDATAVQKAYQAKRDLLLNELKPSKFKIVPSKGSYFQILNFSEISEEKDTEFCNKLLENHKIAVMPLSYFYHDSIDQKYIRLCFAKSDETLVKAANILNRL